MKLIREVIESVTPIITEGVSGKGKEYFIEGPFLQADIKNRNGRIYPLSTLQKEVTRYMKEQVAENRALGELGHPDNPTINLPLVSHRITELRQDGSDFHGKAKILDTPNGRIVKNLVDEGVKLGVSSRGLGSIIETSEGSVVGEDFMLATAADIVSDPSAPNAFVRGIMEGREWVWDNGVLKEAQVATIKKVVESAPKKKRTAKLMAEAKAWESFLKSIRVQLTENDGTLHQDKKGNQFIIKTNGGLSAFTIWDYGFDGVKEINRNEFTITAVDADDIRNAFGNKIISIRKV